MFETQIFLIASLGLLILWVRKHVKKILGDAQGLVNDGLKHLDVKRSLMGKEDEGLKQSLAKIGSLLGIRKGQKTILGISVLGAIILLLYWLLISKTDDMLSMAIAPIIGGMAVFLTGDLAILANARRRIRMAKEEIEKANSDLDRFIDQILEDKPKEVFISGGDITKAFTKVPLKLSNTLKVLFPSDNVVHKDSTFLDFLKYAGIQKDVLECLEKKSEGIFLGKEIAVVVRKVKELKEAFWVLVFQNGELYMRSIVKTVVHGKETVEDAFRRISAQVEDVISWIGKKFNDAIFVVFLPLHGSTGWSVALTSLQLLSGRMMPVILFGRNRTLFDQLVDDVNDKEFKKNKTVEVLSQIVRRGRIFMMENADVNSFDPFDRDVLANVQKLLDWALIKSSGTTDGCRYLARDEISLVQILRFHERNIDGILREDREWIKELGLADQSIPEVVIATQGKEIPAIIKKRLIGPGDATGFVVSHGLYGLKDQILREIFDRSYEILEKAIREEIRREEAGSDEVETILRKRLDKSGELKQAIQILAVLEGKPILKMKKPESEPTAPDFTLRPILEKILTEISSEAENSAQI
ncbi:MAG: hypothetical protein QW734_07210 [Candidatus Bathyarchaeia archaeon]